MKRLAGHTLREDSSTQNYGGYSEEIPETALTKIEWKLLCWRGAAIRWLCIVVACSCLLVTSFALAFGRHRILSTIYRNTSLKRGSLKVITQDILKGLVSPSPSWSDCNSQSEAGDLRAGRGGDCPLGLLYVYELPRKFNKEIVEACKGREKEGECKKMENGGLGPALGADDPEGASGYQDLFGDMSCWFFTHMTRGSGMSEVLYHARMLQQPCRTKNPDLASAFYVPYYASLALAPVIRHGNATLSNELPRAFTAWLADQPYFKRSGGYDHFMVIGGGVWNFLVTNDQQKGCSLLKDPVMQNITKLSNDRNPWDQTTAGIPYPVFFHPSTDEQMQNWQERVRSWPRKHLAAFAGSKSRSGKAFKFSSPRFAFRAKLLDECMTWDRCHALDCNYLGDGAVGRCHHPLLPMQLSMDSEFCLQPPGDTMPRKSIFDGMVAGCIPVFFAEDSAYTQYLWYLPWNRSRYSVFINYKSVENGTLRVKDVLSTYTPESIQAMRNVIVDEILPGLVIGDPRNFHLRDFQDAASKSLEGVMTKVARREAGLEYDLPNPYMLERNASGSYEIMQAKGIACRKRLRKL